MVVCVDEIAETDTASNSRDPAKRAATGSSDHGEDVIGVIASFRPSPTSWTENDRTS